MTDDYDFDIVEVGDAVTLDTERGEMSGTVAEVREDEHGRIITIRRKYSYPWGPDIFKVTIWADEPDTEKGCDVHGIELDGFEEVQA